MLYVKAKLDIVCNNEANKFPVIFFSGKIVQTDESHRKHNRSKDTLLHQADNNLDTATSGVSRSDMGAEDTSATTHKVIFLPNAVQQYSQNVR